MHILLLEDSRETVEWIKELISDVFPETEMTVCNSVREAKLARVNEVNLALLDMNLPDGSGVDVARWLKQRYPACVCVMLTVLADDTSIVSALSHGADGYILKDTPRTLLAKQLSEILEGRPPLSPSIARRIMTHFANTGPVAMENIKLTPRETEILGLVAKGLRNREVASHLGITEATVASYLKDVYRKLGISSRAEASWTAAQLGLKSDW